MVTAADRTVVSEKLRIVAHEAGNLYSSGIAALAAGANGLEVDARLTADHAVVALRSPVVDVGSGCVSVREVSYASLGELREQNGLPPVPTLKDALRWWSGASSGVIVDLKADRPGDATLAMIAGR